MFLKTTTNHIVTMVRWYQHQVWSRWFYLLRIPFPASHFSLFLFSPFSSTFNNVSMSNVKRQQKKYQKNKFLSLRVADVVVFTEERERERPRPPTTTTNNKPLRRAKKDEENASALFFLLFLLDFFFFFRENVGVGVGVGVDVFNKA